MYAPRGLGQSELGEFDVIAAGRQLHLFALTLPNHDVVVHAATEDGLAWRGLPNAIYTGDPGDVDDDEIWSVGLAERDGRYVMLYTALARADDGLVQRTALATSTDLIRWTKDPRGVVAEPDARWYDVAPSPVGRVSWRDPKPLRVDDPAVGGDIYVAPLCAHEQSAPLLRRGCVGLLRSRDLTTWEVCPPLFAPRYAWDLECPQVFEVGGTFYLTASISEDRTQRYWTAERWDGPFSVPPDGGMLAPPDHYAGRVCRWNGEDLLFCQVTVEQERPGFPKRPSKFVAPPLSLDRRPDGSLARRSYSGWEAYRDAAPAPVAPMARTLFGEIDWAPDAGWSLSTGGGMDVLATEGEYGNCYLEGTLTLDGPSGGLAVGLDADGGGLFLALAADATEASIQSWRAGPPRAADRPFRYRELQRFRLPRATTRGEPIPFKLLVVGQYVECSLWGEVVLASFDFARPTGRVGIWAAGGSISADEVGLAEMRVPRHS